MINTTTKNIYKHCFCNSIMKKSVNINSYLSYIIFYIPDSHRKSKIDIGVI